MANTTSGEYILRIETYYSQATTLHVECAGSLGVSAEAHSV